MHETAKDEGRAWPRRSGGTDERRSCPPHGPILVRAIETKVAYVASCLKCGRAGPRRSDGWEAKLAFDESYGSRDPL